MNTERPRGRRWIRAVRAAAIGLVAFAFVLLLPVAPGQPPGGAARDLGTVRTPGAPGAGGAPGASAPAAAASAAGRTSLAYRPFIDPVPIPVHTHWYVLLLPMSFGIAVVYKAVMMRTLDRYWHEVLYLTVQIVVGMIVLGLASYLLVMRYVPFITAP